MCVCVYVRKRADSLKESSSPKLVLKYAVYGPDSVSKLYISSCLWTVRKRNSHKVPLYKLPPCLTPNGLYGHRSPETYLGDFLNMPQKDNLQLEKRQIANKLVKKLSTPTWIREMEELYTPQWNMPLCYPIRRVFQKNNNTTEFWWWCSGDQYPLS